MKQTRLVIVPKNQNIESKVTINTSKIESPELLLINKLRSEDGLDPLSEEVSNELYTKKEVEETLVKQLQENTNKTVVDRKEIIIRKTLSSLSFIGILLVPILLYILICTTQEISTFNIESLTGGFFRVVSGVLAYISMEILVVVLILRLFFKVLLVRLKPNIFTEELQYDFLQEYLSLQSWERIKIDLFILFSLLLLVLVNVIVLLTRIPLVS